MRDNFNDLHAFLVVAREQSFTRAAAQLGVSQSALSHSVRGLETRLGMRLLTRTTRSVSPTAAGQRLMLTLTPRFEEIAAELTSLSELQQKPAGSIRITAAEHTARHVLWPKLSKVLAHYPDIKLEIIVDYGLVDIVAERYDMGVRLGSKVAKDMVAVRIAADMRMACVAAPDYLELFGTPTHPEQLDQHKGINLRLPTHGGLFTWEFQRNGQTITVRTDGQLVFSSSTPILQAAQEGFGLAYLPEDMVLESINAGRLRPVLEDWWPSFTGYHLYYPSSRQPTAAFSIIVDALRYKT